MCPSTSAATWRPDVRHRQPPTTRHRLANDVPAPFGQSQIQATRQELVGVFRIFLRFPPATRRTKPTKPPSSLVHLGSRLRPPFPRTLPLTPPPLFCQNHLHTHAPSPSTLARSRPRLTVRYQGVLSFLLKHHPCVRTKRLSDYLPQIHDV